MADRFFEKRPLIFFFQKYVLSQSCYRKHQIKFQTHLNIPLSLPDIVDIKILSENGSWRTPVVDIVRDERFCLENWKELSLLQMKKFKLRKDGSNYDTVWNDAY